MELNHLTDAQWGEWPNPDSATGAHLSECENCRKEWDRLHNLVKGLADSAQCATEQSDLVWDRQCLSIQRQIATVAERNARPAHLAWAAIFALALLASLLLKTGSREPVQQNATDADRELLVQVEQALDGDVPQALQPASLIANEIDQAAQSQSSSPSFKEKSEHEN